jgi:hypothetical protein
MKTGGQEGGSLTKTAQMPPGIADQIGKQKLRQEMPTKNLEKENLPWLLMTYP